MDDSTMTHDFSDDGLGHCDIQTVTAVVGSSDTSSQRLRDAHGGSAAGVGSAESEATAHTAPMCASPALGIINGSGGGHSSGGTHCGTAAPDPWHEPAALLLAASMTLDDIEGARIAAGNRAGALIRDNGLDEDSPAVVTLRELANDLATLEHGCELTIRRELRKHPMGPWVKGTKGIGEKQGARLIAAIGGDPYLRPDGTPRTVSQLWAYCGYHVLHPGQPGGATHRTSAGVDPSSDTIQNSNVTHWDGAGVAPTRAKGRKANWNAVAKSRAFLVAEACMKQRQSPYRKVYDDTRAKYADATHQAECKRCGPKGKPAQPGSPLSDGHKHARALRAVAKAVLKDMWREAKRLHDLDDGGQPATDTQLIRAPVVDTSPGSDQRCDGTQTRRVAAGESESESR